MLSGLSAETRNLDFVGPVQSMSDLSLKKTAGPSPAVFATQLLFLLLGTKSR